MLNSSYNNTPLHVALREMSLADLVKACGETHPAFLAAAVREATRMKQH